jgi:predicted metal-dependent phosphoesterase TrpH
MDDIIADNEGRYIGKPTFARVLARKGYVENANDAFATIFREPTVRVIRKKTFSSEEVIRLIHAAGGLAVLAHPMEQRHLEETYNQFTERLYPILNRMREYGIDGIECYHPSADEVQAEVLREYTEAHGLVVTAGSDFHTDYQKRDFTRYHRP